jgi:hypothetical protein
METLKDMMNVEKISIIIGMSIFALKLSHKHIMRQLFDLALSIQESVKMFIIIK